jgi:hypothetical protein
VPSGALSCPPNSLRDTAIKRLGKHQANGREIKNCVRTASIMANYRKETLGIEHLETGLNWECSFRKTVQGADQGWEERWRRMNPSRFDALIFPIEV